MSTEFSDYPKGAIAIGGGELQDAYDISLELAGGETLVHTFRGKGQPSGSTGGKRSGKVTFKSSMSRDGFERDYAGNWEKRKVVQCRVKLPGKTVTITGRIDPLNITSNLDSAIDFTATIAGKYSFST